MRGGCIFNLFVARRVLRQKMCSCRRKERCLRRVKDIRKRRVGDATCLSMYTRVGSRLVPVFKNCYSLFFFRSPCAKKKNCHQHTHETRRPFLHKSKKKKKNMRCALWPLLHAQKWGHSPRRTRRFTQSLCVALLFFSFLWVDTD